MLSSAFLSSTMRDVCDCVIEGDIYNLVARPENENNTLTEGTSHDIF
jgi:hypothetical protein